MEKEGLQYTNDEYDEMIQNCNDLIDNSKSFITGNKEDDAIWNNDIEQLNKIKKVIEHQKDQVESNG